MMLFDASICKGSEESVVEGTGRESDADVGLHSEHIVVASCVATRNYVLEKSSVPTTFAYCVLLTQSGLVVRK